MLQLTYELRPKWQNNKNNKNNKTKTKSQNAVSRSDPLQGSDKHLPTVQADALEWATVLIPGDQDVHEGKASSHLVRTYLFKWGGDES